MDPYVRTRWTEDGLVEIRLDAATAQAVLADLGATSGAVTKPVYDSLGHTLLAQHNPVIPKKEQGNG